MKSNMITLGNTRYVSLLGHEIKIKSGKNILKFGKSNTVPRLYNSNVAVAGEIPTYIQVNSYIGQLPKPAKNTIYIVSLFLAQAAATLYPERTDIASPGKKKFGDGGKILYTEGLKLSNVANHKE